MGKRKISILEPASTFVAEIALLIENKGLPQTAKKYVNEVSSFFEQLSDDRITPRPCTYQTWKWLDYRCTTFKKK